MQTFDFDIFNLQINIFVRNHDQMTETLMPGHVSSTTENKVGLIKY